MIASLVMIGLGANGIAAGIMLGNAIGPGALALRLPYGPYVSMIKYLWPRYDPLVPLLNVLAFGLDITCAAMTGGTRSALFALSAALLGVLMIISVTKNVPINKYVTALDEERPPDDWAEADPRAAWQRWNHVRVSLALVSLIANLAGAAVLI
jgi:hypothetical protein